MERCQKAEKERDTLFKERQFALDRAEKLEKELADFAVQKNTLLMQVCCMCVGSVGWVLVCKRAICSCCIKSAQQQNVQ